MYVGRFAPSPTGPLHLGSLFTAVASWLDARAHNGRWLVRIEDLDPPRTEAGAEQRILAALDAYGLHSDGPIIRQSQRDQAYQQALTALSQTGRLFWCRCSRKMLAQHQHYPGTCMAYTQARSNAAAKFYSPEGGHFDDRIQGPYRYEQVEPFVVRRRDLLWAYQLAVVVDDQASGVTDVVRGIDLIATTPMQQALQQALGYRSVSYAHLPVIVADNGQKLSKQNLATAIPTTDCVPVLRWVLTQLGIPPRGTNVTTILSNAVPEWSLAALHKRQTISEH